MNSMSRFTITAADLQFSHDVSGEARDESGKWISGSGSVSHADVKSHVATKLGVHPEVIAYAAKLKAMKTSERENVDFYTNHIGYQYFEAHKLMPKAENDAKFKKLTDGNNFTLSSDAGYLANINGHPFLLNQWKDPDAKFRNDPKEFVWAYCPAGATEFVETHTRDPEELVKIIQDHISKSVLTQMSHSGEHEHEFSSTQFNIEDGEYTRTQGSPFDQIKAMSAGIAEEDLGPDGRENTPHITICFGIHANTERNLRNVVSNFGSVEVVLGKTAMFEAKDDDGQDVVYIEVFGNDIHRLNALIKESTKVTSTFPNYVPHICLAYVRAGKGKDYIGDSSVEGQKLLFTEFQFSGKDREHTEVSLDSKIVNEITDRHIEQSMQDERLSRFSITATDLKPNMSRFSITAEDLDIFDMGQLTFNFDESKHPRGHEGNPGQFVKKGEGKTEPVKTPVATKTPDPIAKTPTPIVEKPKSTLGEGEQSLVDEVEEILADKHWSRGRMTPDQILAMTLENVPSDTLRNLASHPEVAGKHKTAFINELWRRSERRKVALAEEDAKKKAAEEKAKLAPKSQSPRKTISEITGHKATREHVDNTLNHITKLHSALPSMPAIPVKTTTGERTVGQFHYLLYVGRSVSISVSSKSPHPRMTFAHEYGHFLDLELGKHIAGRGSAFASNASQLPQYPDHPAGKLIDAIKKSKATAGIKKHIDGPGAVMRKVNDPKLGEVEVLHLVNFDWLRYLVDPSEQFARAYSQYVAIRSGDDTMKKELDSSRKKEVPGQWDDDDFEPIAKAFDEYFEAVGLTKGK